MRTFVNSKNPDAALAVDEVLERKLDFALSRLQDHIQRVDLFLEDVNGPKGGVCHLVRVIVKLRGTAKTLVIRELHEHPGSAVRRALDRAGCNLARMVERLTSKRQRLKTREFARQAKNAMAPEDLEATPA